MICRYPAHLIEIENIGYLRVQRHCIPCALAKLLPRCCCQQGSDYSESLLGPILRARSRVHSMDEIDASYNVPPLV